MPLIAPVDLVDAIGGGMGLGLRAERDRVGEHQVRWSRFHGLRSYIRGLARAGDDERVRRLHQQRPRAAEQHGDLAMHLPGDALGPKYPSSRVPCPFHGTPRLAVTPAGGLVDTNLAERLRPSRRLPRHDPAFSIVVAWPVCVGFARRRQPHDGSTASACIGGASPLAGLALQVVPVPAVGGRPAIGAAGMLVGSYVLLLVVRLGEPQAPGGRAVMARAAAELPWSRSNGGMPVSAEALGICRRSAEGSRARDDRSIT